MITPGYIFVAHRDPFQLRKYSTPIYTFTSLGIRVSACAQIPISSYSQPNSDDDFSANVAETGEADHTICYKKPQTAEMKLCYIVNNFWLPPMWYS